MSDRCCPTSLIFTITSQEIHPQAQLDCLPYNALMTLPLVAITFGLEECSHPIEQLTVSTVESITWRHRDIEKNIFKILEYVLGSKNIENNIIINALPRISCSFRSRANFCTQIKIKQKLNYKLFFILPHSEKSAQVGNVCNITKVVHITLKGNITLPPPNTNQTLPNITTSPNVIVLSNIIALPNNTALP